MIKKINKNVVRIIQILYLIYMFYFFKTSVSIHHPFESKMTSFTEYLKHPINSGKYESKICQFGKDAMILLIIYLVIRCFVKYPKICNIIMLSLTIIVSFLNMNAVLYIIPFVISELLILN